MIPSTATGKRKTLSKGELLRAAAGLPGESKEIRRGEYFGRPKPRDLLRKKGRRRSDPKGIRLSRSTGSP